MFLGDSRQGVAAVAGDGAALAGALRQPLEVRAEALRVVRGKAMKGQLKAAELLLKN